MKAIYSNSSGDILLRRSYSAVISAAPKNGNPWVSQSLVHFYGDIILHRVFKSQEELVICSKQSVAVFGRLTWRANILAASPADVDWNPETLEVFNVPFSF